MSTQAGLSFEQAPPFSLPLQFFLSAPLFLLAAALLVVMDPASLTSRWTPQALGTLALMTKILSTESIANSIAIVLLVIGFAVFLAAAAVSLVRATSNVTVWGMRLAVLSLLLTFMLGLALALIRAGAWSPPAAYP